MKGNSANWQYAEMVRLLIPDMDKRPTEELLVGMRILLLGPDRDGFDAVFGACEHILAERGEGLGLLPDGWRFGGDAS